MNLCMRNRLELWFWIGFIFATACGIIGFTYLYKYAEDVKKQNTSHLLANSSYSAGEQRLAKVLPPIQTEILSDRCHRIRGRYLVLDKCVASWFALVLPTENITVLLNNTQFIELRRAFFWI